MSRFFYAIALGLAAGCAQANAKQPAAWPLEQSLTRRAIKDAPLIQFAQAAGPSTARSNLAKLVVTIVPNASVAIGAKVGFEVTSASRGYVLLVDIDPTGRMTQIFPNPELLERLGKGDINLIQQNGKLTIPSVEIRARGFDFLVGEPTGSATIVAILSRKKVQLVDLPDNAESDTAAASVDRLSKWIYELKVADPDSGKLLTNEWSYTFKNYEIR